MEKPSLEAFLANSAQFGTAPTYELNLRAAKAEISERIAKILAERLNNIRAQYDANNPDLLYMNEEIRDVDLNIKPFPSVLNKIYRQNVLYNRAYPRPQAGGALDAVNLYQKIDDLLRLRIICKYMDGPKFVVAKLEEFAGELGLECKSHSMGTAAGYYAWHFYLKVPATINVNGDIIEDRIWVEVQVTTQLAAVMYALTHKLYERRRLGELASPESWAWDPSTQEFQTTFLGHGLHLMEGLILRLKEEVVGDQALGPPQNENAE